MGSMEDIIERERMFTAWMSTFPPFTVLAATWISLRFTLLPREVGALLNLILMMLALFLFIVSDRFVRKIVFSEEIDAEAFRFLFRRASYLSGFAIPLAGFISAIAVGQPDATFVSFSFMIISLSGLGSAWKRFADKLTGKIVLPPRSGKG